METELAAALKLLADENRLRLLALLEAEELSVQELVQITGLGQSRVSHHLGLLRRAGVVRDRRDGTWTFYQERPYYLVFAVDRFNLVAEKHIDKSLLRYDELKQKPFADVIPVFARLPEDQEKFQEFLHSVLNGEPDLESRPEFWEPYAAGTDAVLARTRPIGELRRTTETDERRVRTIIDRHEAEHPNLGILPIGTVKNDIGMIMDMDTAEPLDIVLVDPWPVHEDAAAKEMAADDSGA